MFQGYISKCVNLHYCANVNLDKNLWDKHKKQYKKNETGGGVIKPSLKRFHLFFGALSPHQADINVEKNI
jgi:hypothetical protein